MQTEVVNADQTDAGGLVLRPLAQFERGDPWRLTTLHDRPDYLLIWITKGQGLAHVSGLRRGIGAHTALLIPPQTLFSLDLLRGAGALVLTLPADLAEALSMPHRPQVLRLRDVQAQAELTHRLEAIQREAASPAPHTGDALRAHGALLSVSLRRFLAAQDQPPRPSGARRLAEAYASLVTCHYASSMGVADYAQMLGVTTPHLSRSCKEASGLTAADILTARELYAARDLIERSDMTLKQIAEALNFGSAAYFSRFIVKHTGKSPSSLRKSVRKAKRPQPA